MKRSKTIVFILCFVLVICGVVGAIAMFGKGSLSPFLRPQMTYELNYSDHENGPIKNFSTGDGVATADKVSKVQINWFNGNVDFQKSTDGQIHFNETANFSLSEKERMRYIVHDGVLSILYSTPGKFRFPGKDMMEGKKLTISLPEKLFDVEVDTSSADIQMAALRLQSLSVDVTSGKLNAPNITADTFKFDGSSGDCEIGGKFKTVEVDVSSGKLEALDLTADTFDFESSSGDCKISGKFRTVEMESSSGKLESQSLKTDTLRFNSSSGNCTVSGSLQSVFTDTTSGRISLTLMEAPVELEHSSSSGDFKISIPENDGFTANYFSGSGKFTCDFPGQTRENRFVYGTGTKTFSFDTTSGDIAIKEG